MKKQVEQRIGESKEERTKQKMGRKKKARTITEDKYDWKKLIGLCSGTAYVANKLQL